PEPGVRGPVKPLQKNVPAVAAVLLSCRHRWAAHGHRGNHYLKGLNVGLHHALPPSGDAKPGFGKWTGPATWLLPSRVGVAFNGRVDASGCGEAGDAGAAGRSVVEGAKIGSEIGALISSGENSRMCPQCLQDARKMAGPL